MVDHFLNKKYRGVKVGIWPYGHNNQFVVRATIVDALGHIITSLDRESFTDNIFESYTDAMKFATEWVYEKLEKEEEKENDK